MQLEDLGMGGVDVLVLNKTMITNAPEVGLLVENLLDGSVKFTAPTMVKKTELFKDVVSSFNV